MAEPSPTAPPDLATVGDFKFAWGPASATVTTDALDIPGKVLFAIRLAEHPLRPNMVEWVMMIMGGKNWIVSLGIDHREQDRGLIALQSIVEYKQLGLGKDLKW